MPRSDLLIKLVRASSIGDQLLFKRTLEAVIAEERQKQHHVLADRLTEYLKTNGNGELKGPTVVDDRIQQLLIEAIPQRSIDDLILPEVVVTACRELIEEHQRRDLLRSYNLEPRSKVLLVGPPGNGKTSLAEALAEALAIPLLIVRYEGVIGSYLGETAVRLRRLFDYVRTRQCVLFFDEFDTVGKERGDVHETGEIKRVVSSLLLQVDSLPSHVLVVTATNHPELLDRAVWRRFQLRLSLPAPNQQQLQAWVNKLEKKIKEPIGYTPSDLAEKLRGLSFAEAEEFGADVLRRRILNVTEKSMKRIIDERLKQWTAQYKQTGEQKISL